jgi:5-methylcytosine-specific restriction endonuclease McrA
MKLNGKPVKAIYLTRYCKSRLGYAGKPGVALYDLVCMALEVDGMPLPMGMSSRQWVKLNVDHIVGKNRTEKIKSCAVQSVVVKPKPETKSIRAGGVDVASDAFLSTFQWRKVRMEALKKYGPRCQCCGATPATGAVMNVDHIKPRKKWPSLALDVNNLQVLCHDCNHGKGNWDDTDWRALKNPHEVGLA